MKKSRYLLLSALVCSLGANAAIEGSLDPACVVEQWSGTASKPRVIDINFNDTSWPDTWTGETGRDCPEWDSGAYVNAVLDVPANGSDAVRYPVVFHNCAFATKASANGFGGATAAFSRQYYVGEKCAGNSATTYNNWTVAGHTHYLEDNIEYKNGKPVHGEAGFVQMCRSAADKAAPTTSLHGWVEIDHIPYVEKLEWSWSSTSWGRGIKLDIKIGDGDWEPLVWMGSEKQKQGWTVFSDQGYFMENDINAADVSLRWRVWDGEVQGAPVQSDVFNQYVDPLAQRQAPRVHKIRIYGDELTAAAADFARANPVNDPGELTDLSKFGFTGNTQTAPDADAPTRLLLVNPDGSADYTTVQGAIDAVAAGERGIIVLAPGVYDENIYAGRKGEAEKYISLVGTDAATTVLTSSVNRGSGPATYLDCAALNVFTPRFYAEKLTIRNTSGNVGQAEALYTAGDAHTFSRCSLEGYQDTYKANVGARGYFDRCTVSGATDFIYDGGLEWFEDCTLRCVRGGGYVTAPGTSGMPMSQVRFPELGSDNLYPGLFFNKCTVETEEGVADGAYALARPWQENGGAAFLRSKLGSHIKAAGWNAWNGNENSASFLEYRNTDLNGNALDTSVRAAFSRQATDAETEAYLNPEFLFSNFSKVPFDYEAILRAPAAPSDFTLSEGLITWTGDADAAGYIVYREGQPVAVVSETLYRCDDARTAAYSVASLSRTGASSVAASASVAGRMLAFPTAEGFGKFATGGRGGKVVKVTSLADDGSAGTLRAAFAAYPGQPITILFDVCGEIALNSELRVNRANWTLAGQSAPGQGIVITRNKVNLGGSQNFIVRNVRFRIGQKSVGGEILAENALGAENCANFIFDHCTFGWSVEENMNTADSHFLTVQNCIVHEGLFNAGHSKGARGYGCQWGGSPATYHHNLLAHNNSRSARLNGARGEDNVVFLEYINNVNYNYGKTGNCYGGENTADISDYTGLNSAHDCNFQNNYYRPGPYSNKTSVTFMSISYARDGAKSWAPGKWFIDGNVAHGMPTYTGNNWAGVTTETYTKEQLRADRRIVTETPWYRHTLAGATGQYVPEVYMLENIETAEDAYKTVLAKAGTVNRDKVEQRVVREATDGTSSCGNGGIIDLETQAEGFFAYEAAAPATDTDGDGIPDAWETANGLDPRTPDSNFVNSEGYTALEVYLNSLMGETQPTDFRSGVAALTLAPLTLRYDRATDTLSVAASSAAASALTLSVYATDGTLLMQKAFSGSVSLASLPEGVLLLQVTAPGAAPAILKLRR